MNVHDSLQMRCCHGKRSHDYFNPSPRPLPVAKKLLLSSSFFLLFSPFKNQKSKKQRIQVIMPMELRVANKFRIGRKIGAGSFGDIYLGNFNFFYLIPIT